LCAAESSGCCRLSVFFFFFQAEDGIRDRNVTGVQTCALPILKSSRSAAALRRHRQLLHPSTTCGIGFTELTVQISGVLREFILTVLMASKRDYSLASQLARWQDSGKSLMA